MPNGHHRRHCDNGVGILLVFVIASSIAATVSASHQHCHCRCSRPASSISTLSLSLLHPLRPCLCHSATAISSAAASAPSIDVVLGRFSPAASSIAFVFLIAHRVSIVSCIAFVLVIVASIAPSCQHCPRLCLCHSTIHHVRTALFAAVLQPTSRMGIHGHHRR